MRSILFGILALLFAACSRPPTPSSPTSSADFLFTHIYPCHDELAAVIFFPHTHAYSVVRVGDVLPDGSKIDRIQFYQLTFTDRTGKRHTQYRPTPLPDHPPHPRDVT